MSRQLVLIPATGADWRLDERTRETGRQGVAAAREALRRAAEARRMHADDDEHGRERATATPRKPAA